jgi:hypothetical protein
MPATTTSKNSYKQLTDLGEKQRETYEAIKKIGPASDRELADLLDWEINVLIPRRTELESYGFIKRSGVKWNHLTKRHVTQYVAADPLAQRELEKSVGKTKNEHKEINPNMKYLLKLKDGRRFTISAAMKEEIEEAMAAKRGSKTIELANQVFVLSNIALPIVEFGNAAAAQQPVKEDTHERTLIEIDGAWQVTNIPESKLKRDRIEFRTQRIGKSSGMIKSDLMTVYDGPYEAVRNMMKASHE